MHTPTSETVWTASPVTHTAHHTPKEHPTQHRTRKHSPLQCSNEAKTAATMSSSVFLPAKAPHSKPTVLASTRLPLGKPTSFFQEEYPREWLADKTAAAKAQSSSTRIEPPKRTAAPAPGTQPQAKLHRPLGATPKQTSGPIGLPTGTAMKRWIPPKQLPAARTIRPDHLVTLPSGMAVSNTCT